MCAMLWYLSTIHQFVFISYKKSQDNAAAQLLLVEILKISPSLNKFHSVLSLIRCWFWYHVFISGH